MNPGSENIFKFEKKAGEIPNEREVRLKIDSILDGRSHKVEIEQYDEKGLFWFHTKTTSRDGGTEGIDYKRSSKPNTIYTVFYAHKDDDIPIGDGPQYDFIDGEWKEIA